MKHLFTILFFFCSFAAFSQVTTTVSTKVSDQDGTVSSVKIELLSGPTGSIIATPNPPVNAVTTDISFTQVGVYIFQISAVDNDGTITKIQFKATIVQNMPPKIEFVPDVTLKIK